MHHHIHQVYQHPFTFCQAFNPMGFDSPLEHFIDNVVRERLNMTARCSCGNDHIVSHVGLFGDINRRDLKTFHVFKGRDSGGLQINIVCFGLHGLCLAPALYLHFK